jgi:hypothetical protein
MLPRSKPLPEKRQRNDMLDILHSAAFAALPDNGYQAAHHSHFEKQSECFQPNIAEQKKVTLLAINKTWLIDCRSQTRWRFLRPD